MNHYVMSRLASDRSRALTAEAAAHRLAAVARASRATGLGGTADPRPERSSRGGVRAHLALLLGRAQA